MELIVIIRIVLVVLLVLVGVGGFLNMKRMKKKKKALENFSYDQQGGASQQPLSPAEEYAKNYILQYKTSYPRDSLKQALMGVGYSDVDVENWLNKYF